MAISRYFLINFLPGSQSLFLSLSLISNQVGNQVRQLWALGLPTKKLLRPPRRTLAVKAPGYGLHAVLLLGHVNRKLSRFGRLDIALLAGFFRNNLGDFVPSMSSTRGKVVAFWAKGPPCQNRESPIRWQVAREV
uniref:Uncharacterized protein n=1 Tax=Bionectria ochroleuca TaxID=29856 RepID=A0A8H7K7C4_BIOOC